MPLPFRANTSLERLSPYKIRKIIRLGVDFCALHLGKMRNRAYPITHVSFLQNSEVWGEYDPDQHWIWIYPKRCPTVSYLLRTLIHEWTHSIQRIRTEYRRLYRLYGYDDHPLEKEAFAAEEQWIRFLIRYVQTHWSTSRKKITRYKKNKG